MLALLVALAAAPLTGRVVDSAGEPIAGAEVVRRPYAVDDAAILIDAERTQTDADGRFRFAEPGHWRGFVTATAPGYAIGSASWFVGYEDAETADDPQVEPLTITLHRPGWLTLHVVDREGEPVEGASVATAEVRIDSEPILLSGDWTPRWPDLTTRSENDGALRLTHLPVGDDPSRVRVSLTLSHPERGRRHIETFDLTDPPDPVAMPGGVRVRYAIDGLPPAIDRVSLHIAADSRDVRRIESVPVRDGVVEFVVPPNEPLDMVALSAPGFAIRPTLFYDWRHDGSDDEAPRIVFFEPTTIDASAAATHEVVGRVIDAESGEPIAGVDIEAESFDPAARPVAGSSAPLDRAVVWRPGTAFAVTDGDGRYRFRLPEGRVRIEARASAIDATAGYEPQPRERTIDVTGEGIVENDAATDGYDLAPWPLRRLPPLRGRVLDANGEPIAGAIVRLRGGTERSMLSVSPPVRTDPDGRFTLPLPTRPEDMTEDGFQPAATIPLVAFDPDSGASGTLAVDAANKNGWDDLRITMRPDTPWLPLTAFPDTLSDYERGEASAMTDPRPDLVAAAAPPLFGQRWWNVPDGGSSLDWPLLRGQWVLLDFYFTSCGPCRVKTPMLVDLQARYGGEAFGNRFTVLGVHAARDSIAKAEAYIREAGIDYPVVYDTEDGAIVEAFTPHGLRGYPTMMLIDPAGRVAISTATVSGPTLYHFAPEIVRALLLTDAQSVDDLPATLWRRVPTRE